MFDIGFWEIALISVIGLVVLGPERLPTAIRSVMHWINTVKGVANSVKTEISQELKLHELNEKNNNMIKATKNGFENLDAELQKSIDEMKKSAEELSGPYQPKPEDPQQSESNQPATVNQPEQHDTAEPVQKGKKIDE